MTLSYLNSIAVFEVVVYVPLFVAAVYLWIRDGFGPGSAAWRFCTTFCCLRLVGSICSLVAISHSTEGLESAILVSEVVGIPPLTLSLITLFDRINAEAKILPKFTMLAILLVAVPALVLGIYGGDQLLNSKTAILEPNAYIKAAMATFLFLYACLVALVVLFASKWSSYQDPVHKRIVVATLLATPALGVKHIDAALSDYSHIDAFGITGFNTTAYLVMSVLMELITVGINLGFGLSCGPPPKKPERSEQDAESDGGSAEKKTDASEVSAEAGSN